MAALHHQKSGVSTKLAHVAPCANGGWKEHHLDEHLTAVSRLASGFAKGFAGQNWASAAGLWHDLGKYRPAFQNYIRSASGYEPEAHVDGRVDHSTAGAIHAVRQWGVHGRVLAYLIAGHHAGLPDWEKLEEGTGGSLKERLAKGELLDEALATGIPEDLLRVERPEFRVPGDARGFALWVRMLFSSLVDADFLDTEAFMDGERAE